MSWDVPANPQEELAKKRAAAKEAVYKAWMAKLVDSQGNPLRGGLSVDEKTTMGQEVEIADAKAIIDYVVSKLLVTILPTAIGLQNVVSLGAPTGPPAAPVPLPPGSISFKPPTTP